MTGYAEVSVKDYTGKVIGTFRVDLPEKPIGDENPETSGTRFVIDERTGGTYGVGLGAVYLGVAAARGTDAPTETVKEPVAANMGPVTEPKFKVGDRVKVIGNGAKSPAGRHSIDTGTIVTIDGARDSDGDYWVIADGDHQQYVYEDDLRGIQPGDRVRITNNDHFPRHRLSIGSYATVTRVGKSEVHARGVDRYTGVECGQFVSALAFEWE